jgi:hypothetical protein
MEGSEDRPFLDLDDAGLASRVEAAGIPPSFQAGVLQNLRTLQIHARRVSDALAADPALPDAASSRPATL